MGDAEALHLHQAARQQRGLGVVAELQTVADARRDGEHVLERSGEFHPDEVGVGVDPQPVAAEVVLHPSCECGIFARGDEGSRPAAGDFFRVAGAAQHHDFRHAEFPADDLARPSEGFDLDALRQTDDGDTGVGDGVEQLQRGTQIRRGDGRDPSIGPAGRILDGRRDRDRIGDADTGELLGVLAQIAQALGHVAPIAPEPDFVLGALG